MRIKVVHSINKENNHALAYKGGLLGFFNRRADAGGKKTRHEQEETKRQTSSPEPPSEGPIAPVGVRRSESASAEIICLISMTRHWNTPSRQQQRPGQYLQTITNVFVGIIYTARQRIREEK
jgi:hypothetical protein